MGNTLKEFLSELPEGQCTVLNFKGDAAGAGAQTVEVGRRQLQPEPRNEKALATSPPRLHEFHGASGFVSYLRKYGTDVVLYIDVPAGKVYAILEERRMAGGYERLTFQPQTHPKWAPWEELLGKTVALDALVDFVRENRRTIVEPEGRSLAMALSQVKASTNIELHAGQGKESLNGLLVKTRIQGQDHEAVVELPDVLGLLVPIYVSTEPKKIELDLIIETDKGGTQIVARLSSGDIQEAKIQAFAEMAKEIEALAASGK